MRESSIAKSSVRALSLFNERNPIHRWMFSLLYGFPRIESRPIFDSFAHFAGEPFRLFVIDHLYVGSVGEDGELFPNHPLRCLLEAKSSESWFAANESPDPTDGDCRCGTSD